MTPRHFRFWPKGLPRSLSFPRVPLHELLEVSARRYPDKPASWFFGAALTWREAGEQALRLAGYLQRACGVRPGDRVLVDLQNSPQFLLAAFAISRADAVMVPVSPACVTGELAHYLEDSGARAAIVGQEVWPRLADLVGRTPLERVIAAAYSDYVDPGCDLPRPEAVAAARKLGCDSIVMGCRGMGAIKSLILGSTATKVIHLATVPVTIVK